MTSAQAATHARTALDAVTQYEFLPEGKTFQADQEIIFEMGEDE